MRLNIEIGERLEKFLDRRGHRIIDLLQTIIGRLDRMNANEQKLNDTLVQVGETIGQGFTSINEAVASAADRVIAKLQASEVDLTDEIASLEAMKSSVAQQANSTVDQLNQITPEEVVIPPVEEAPPAEDTTGTGTTDAGADTGASPGTETDTGTTEQP